MLSLRSAAAAILCLVGLASPAASQPSAPPPFEVLRAFDNPPIRPLGGLIEVDGALYGASQGGLFDKGTVFRLSPPAAGSTGRIETVYSFTDTDFEAGRGGAFGELLRASNGNLYGLRSRANSNTTWGSLFRLSASGVLTTLHDFAYADGVVYDYIGGQGPLVEMDQVLYGTLYYGGTANLGALFRIGLDGSGYEVLHRFAGPEGGRPEGGLLPLGGWLYGTASSGGADGGGTLFRISPSGAFEVLHDFMGSAEGIRPRGALVLGPDGLVYGAVTVLGPRGCGTVFSFAPTSPQSLNVLHSFACGSADGTNPEGGMVVVPGADGQPVIFGLATAFSNAGFGSIYRMSPGGAFTVLETLDSHDRCSSQLVRARDGFIYGQCFSAQGWRAGHVFRIDPSGAVSRVLTFGVQDGGRTPFALIEGRDGQLYGSARAGGAHNRGIVYRLSRDGAFDTLHSFTDGAESYESGPSPYSAAPTRASATFLTHGTDGLLYGTRCDGGTGGQGSLFRLDPESAEPAYELLHSARYGDMTACPHGPLVESQQGPGTFLGTATGDEYHGGAAFRFTPGGQPEGLWERRPLLDYTIYTEPIGRLVERPDGSVHGAYTIWDPNYDFVYGGVFRWAAETGVTRVHRFLWGEPFGPTSGLVEGPASAAAALTLYGTSPRGGASGWGTVYKVTVPETGATSFSVLRSFGGPPDGQGPRAELVRGPDGAYHGTTSLGGQFGYGTVFALGADEQVSTIHHFNYADGAYPETELVAATDGNLYGVTPRGGPGGGGVLFRINLTPAVKTGGPYTVAEGGVVTLEATGADPQGGSLDFAWDLDGDGAFDDASGASADFAADQPARDGDGVYEVSVRVTDATGLSAVAKATVTVANVAPSVSIAPAGLTLDPRQSGVLTVTFTDPGPDTWTMRIDYGDGTLEDRAPTSPGPIALAHAWADPGRYTVQVTVADDDGGSAAAAVTVEIGGPEDSIRWLIEEVEDLLGRGELRRGQAASLIAELRLALWFLQFPNGEGAAAVMLDLFVREVDFYVRTGVLDPEEGNPLSETARSVIAQLRAP